MTKTPKLRMYQVSYSVEQGFFIYIEARSPAHAEKLVRAALDEEMDPLPDSERVHYDDGVWGVQRVK